MRSTRGRRGARGRGGSRLYFLVSRRVPPVPSPVLQDVYAVLERRGYEVQAGIAEELVRRPDRLDPDHDLYVLKSHTELSLSLAGVLYHRGARMLNPYLGSMAVQNKIIASRILGAARVPTPECWVTGDLGLLRNVVGERSVILKPYLGHRGQGVHVVRNVRDLESIPPPDTPVLVQEYIEGCGEDLKVYVVGDEVYAVRKVFSADSFTRSGRPCTVGPWVTGIARQCGAAFGIGLFGLDLVERDGRCWVVDVNTFPGYKGVPHVAPRIADYIDGFASGRIDLRIPGWDGHPALTGGSNHDGATGSGSSSTGRVRHDHPGNPDGERPGGPCDTQCSDPRRRTGASKTAAGCCRTAPARQSRPRNGSRRDGSPSNVLHPAKGH